MSRSSIVSILDQCIEAMAPERSKDKYGDGYHAYTNGYQIGGGLSFNEWPFLEALDAALEYWIMRHQCILRTVDPISGALFRHGYPNSWSWDSEKGWLCDCID